MHLFGLQAVCFSTLDHWKVVYAKNKNEQGKRHVTCARLSYLWLEQKNPLTPLYWKQKIDSNTVADL